MTIFLEARAGVVVAGDVRNFSRNSSNLAGTGVLKMNITIVMIGAIWRQYYQYCLCESSKGKFAQIMSNSRRVAGPQIATKGKNKCF